MKENLKPFKTSGGFTNEGALRVFQNMGPYKIFFHIDSSTFYDPLIPKNPQKSPNARTLMLVPKHFYIWGIDAIKIFSELVKEFRSYPHF